MSLINQMLKDLDNRPKMNPEVALSGLYNVSPRMKKSNPMSIILWLAIIAFVGSLVFLFTQYYLSHKSHVQQPILTNSPTFYPSQTLETIQPFAPSAILTGITLQTQADMTYLRFLVNQNVLYRLDADNNNQKLIITLENARLTTTLPAINYLRTGIQNISMFNEDGNLKIIIIFNQGATLQRLNFTNGKLPEMQLEIQQPNMYESGLPKALANTPPVPAVMESDSGSFKKLVVDMSVEQQYQKALNDPIHTIELLTQLLQKYPSYHDARKTLVALLMQKNDLPKANQLLDIGLKLQPNNIVFLQLKARLLVDSGNTSAALALLEQATPSFHDHSDYYAFIAALYQRQGDGIMAAKMYQQLLGLNPSNGIWWTGLGIALDSVGRHDEAVKAFDRASNSNVNPELKAFLASRMQVDV